MLSNYTWASYTVHGFLKIKTHIWSYVSWSICYFQYQQYTIKFE